MMSCQKITCGSPRVLPFTTIKWPKDPRTAIVYEGTADYECFEGYTLTGKPRGKAQFSVKCQANGTITEPKVCEPVQCGLAPPVPKSRAAISGDVMYGMHLEYLCDTGYSL